MDLTEMNKVTDQDSIKDMSVKNSSRQQIRMNSDKTSLERIPTYKASTESLGINH